MKGKKKGISSILGALIFLQILLISLLLVIHVINSETNITLKSVQKFQVLSENAPIEEEVENNITYLYSTTPLVITHVIYPDGEVFNTSIVVNNKYPISRILNGSPWAIIVTSKGTWYNVTPLGNDPWLITFPNYHNYGMPLDPSVLDMSLPAYTIAGLGNDYVPVTPYPDWNVLDGIASPSAFSLVPVNVTVGDPTTYHWALTDTALVLYPLSSDGWINITYYLPMKYTFAHIGPREALVLFEKGFAQGCYYWNYDNGSIGVYIPINISVTLALNVLDKETDKPTNIYLTQSTSFLQYVYIFDGNGEITNFTYAWNGHQPIGYSWTYTEIGTYNSPPNCFYFPFYLITSNPQSVFGHEIVNTCTFPAVYEIPSTDLPPVNWFNWSDLHPEPILYYPLWNVTQTKFPQGLFGTHFIPAEYIPITVYQLDINLHKGEVLDYAYDGYNNTWLLLYNWTFNYNNPAMYINAYKYFVQLGYHFPAGQYNDYFGYIFPYNINNIEYLTNYPVYVTVPKGVYLLQISLS